MWQTDFCFCGGCCCSCPICCTGSDAPAAIAAFNTSFHILPANWTLLFWVFVSSVGKLERHHRPCRLGAASRREIVVGRQTKREVGLISFILKFEFAERCFCRALVGVGDRTINVWSKGFVNFELLNHFMKLKLILRATLVFPNALGLHEGDPGRLFFFDWHCTPSLFFVFGLKMLTSPTRG